MVRIPHYLYLLERRGLSREPARRAEHLHGRVLSVASEAR